MFRVGIDIPAGEYAVFTSRDRSGYFGVFSDVNQNNIIYNDNFDYNMFVTVVDGEYLKLSGCYAVSLAENDIRIDVSKGTMFRVGIDIPAGEYKLVADAGKDGYYAVYDNSRQDNIITNDIFGAQGYVTVSDGQNLILSRCHIDQ